jgi:hypothetical protein
MASSNGMGSVEPLPSVWTPALSPPCDERNPVHLGQVSAGPAEDVPDPG